MWTESIFGSLVLTVTYVFTFKDTIYGIFFSGVESHRNTPGRVYVPARFKDTFVSLLNMDSIMHRVIIHILWRVRCWL